MADKVKKQAKSKVKVSVKDLKPRKDPKGGSGKFGWQVPEKY